MSKKVILAIDQGTTSSRAIVFDCGGSIVAVAQHEFPQIYPDDGWVEHCPEAIWQTTIEAAKTAFSTAEAKGFTVEAIGITNQRETTIVWDRDSGKPIYNAIVWQDRRTAASCNALKEKGLEPGVQAKSGLLLDPYFSATKVAWILDYVDGARARAEEGRLAFGTVDSFLINRLTGGKQHVTDATNASRTNLFNIVTQDWDEDLLAMFDVPAAVLPRVLDCAANFGETSAEFFGRPIPILGVAGDQQAAAIGQCCFQAGAIKSTYGTGCFILLNTGPALVRSNNRLLTTLAYRLKGETTYALEGSIFIAGAAVQWLRDGIHIVDSAAEAETLCRGLSSNEGVYMVPAFTGLGAPHWDPAARASIFGMTRATGRAALVRAALESVCYQTADLFSAMAEDGVKPVTLKVDGGMAVNSWLMQFLADLLELPVERPAVMETTALGAAYLAGLQAGLYESLEDIAGNWRRERVFKPRKAGVTGIDMKAQLAKWHKAVACTRNFGAD
ncbi:MAG: glycerol kinase GlpK [Kordiimonadaceae bacterium]|nr:glycerol kinase GlpK [Kordiimonadaceae bacterium]